MAGTIVKCGADVTGAGVGDRVFGVAEGAFAEYAVADPSTLAPMPRDLEFTEAAAFPTSALTALEAVRARGKVQAGQRVLVIGASGGVGGYAVQIAVAADAAVTGVASGGKAEFVRSLGARRSIDYATTDVTDLPDRYDLIIDINGRMPVRRLVRLLTRSGTLVIVGGEDGGRLLGGIQRQLGTRIRSLFTRRRLDFLIFSPTATGLAEISALVAARRLRATLEPTGVYALASVREAVEDLVAGRIRGKAVIHMTD